MGATAVYAEANIGIFGQLRPKTFDGVLAEKEAREAISEILAGHCFPVLNIMYCAAAKLEVQDGSNLGVQNKLKDLGVEVSLQLHDLSGQPVEGGVHCFGIYPSETRASGAKEGLIQAKPDLENLASAGLDLASLFFPMLTGFAKPAKALFAGLGLSLGKLIPPRFTLQGKAFIQSPTEFGWIHRIDESDKYSPEGPQYAMAFLMVKKPDSGKPSSLRVTLRVACDWEEGKNEIKVFTHDLPLFFPSAPQTPQIYDFQKIELLPLTLDPADVAKLFGLQTIDDEFLKTHQLKKIGNRITRGSLAKALGL